MAARGTEVLQAHYYDDYKYGFDNKEDNDKENHFDKEDNQDNPQTLTII